MAANATTPAQVLETAETREHFRDFHLTGRGLDQLTPPGALRPALLERLPALPGLETFYPMCVTTQGVARPLRAVVKELEHAGIIVSAVGDELLLAEPLHHPDAAHLAVTLGGAGLFLLGNILFKGVPRGHPPLSHLVGLGLLAVLTLAASLEPGFSLILINGLCNTILCLVAGWEAWSLRPSDRAA